MARAMSLATEAGRLHLAGRIPVKAYASASSPAVPLPARE